MARIAWWAVVLLTAGLFVASLPVNYANRRLVCPPAPCDGTHLTRKDELALHDLGVTVEAFAVYFVALDILVAVVHGVSAAVIVIRKPDDGLALFVSLTLVTFGAVTLTSAAQGLAGAYPPWRLPTAFLALLGDVSIIAFFFVFPTGQLAPRRSWVILLLWTAMETLRYFFPSAPFNLQNVSRPLYNLLFASGIVSGMCAQVYRYWRVSGPAQRQQTKWAVFGIVMSVVGFLATNLAGRAVPAPDRQILLGLALYSIQLLFILLMPLSMAIAVLRYRLWEVDPLINRTLVYGALTAIVVGLYVFIVGALGALFQTQGNLVISVVATGVAAVLFEPLRARLQRGVNRLMYGERDDPSTVLARLGQRLEATLAPDAVLTTIVETVAYALKLPYAAITLQHEGEERSAAEHGRPQPNLIRLPLTYQSETLGQLLLAPRAPGESFSPADQRLLTLLAQAAGVAVHAVRLTNELRLVNADLQRSREHLITAREEERRRLRRDLHDGVGPTLASLSQRLDNARLLVPRDPDAAVALIEAFKGQVKSTIAEIRRLVYALRPPVLDELGLVSAIREHTTQSNGSTGLRVTLSAPNRLPPLPAAVEVAAYRIALEAFTNVTRHAHATTCDIGLSLEGGEPPSALCVEITDDGRGLPPGHRAGVGVTSMRERAVELGGECVIERSPAGGTRVQVRLPIPQESA